MVLQSDIVLIHGSIDFGLMFWLLFSRGLSPEEADLQYLKIAASKLVMFGVDAHPAWVRGFYYFESENRERGTQIFAQNDKEKMAKPKEWLLLNWSLTWTKMSVIRIKELVSKMKVVVQWAPSPKPWNKT